MVKDPDFLIKIVEALKWPVLILIIVLVFIFKFHRQITDHFFKPLGKFLNRLKQIKSKGFEANTMSQEKKEQEEAPKKEEQSKEDKKAENKEFEAQKVDHPKNLGDWRTELILAFMNRDRKRLDDAYNEILKLEQNSLSRKIDEIQYLKFSHTLGNTDAIPKLRESLTYTDVSYETNMALGFCYESSDDFENSNLFYFQALEKARNDDEKSLAASNYSSSLYRDNKKHRAIEVLVEALSAIRDDTCRVRLYESLADIYEKEGDFENRAFVLDKAIELRPSDPSLIFKAGYSYARSNYDELSLLHYKNAKVINTEDDAVQNNLGVQYDNLKMPIKSIVSYREAERLGNTLASANLAYRFINAGFTNEANEILNSAKEKEDVHPNVNAALSEIPKEIEKENEIEEERIKSARELRKFILGFTQAKFAKDSALNSVAGVWKDKKESKFQFEVSKYEIKATWKKKFFNYEQDWKLEGQVFNNSSAVTIYEKEYNFFKNEYEYKKNAKGLLFCSPDGNTIRFVEIVEIGDSNNTREFHILKRDGIG